MAKLLTILMTGLLVSITFVNCSKQDVGATQDVAETAQQIGDVMSSIDESSGSASGDITIVQHYQKTAERMFARYAPDDKPLVWSKILLPAAEATSCSGYGFGSCTVASGGGATITRSFGGCTVGLAQFTGDVTLNFTNSSCKMLVTGDKIERSPNIAVSGRRGAILVISKTSSLGQRLTRGASSASYTFSSDGINRKFTANGQTLYDQTTSTVTDINVTGAARASRTLSGGTLRVVNNLTAQVCDYTPSAVQWQASCNCPLSGTWSGSCTGGVTSTLTFTSTCGTVTYTEGSETRTVALDRCGT